MFQNKLIDTKQGESKSRNKKEKEPDRRWRKIIGGREKSS
jgi:hypothetical protein